MKLVLKVGGAALEDVARVAEVSRMVARLVHEGHRLAVVHGGGAALTRVLRELGRESRFVGGLRVTDAKTRDVAVMVLAGQTNKRLVAALEAAGARALGLCGGDLSLIRATKKRAVEDLGFVGEVQEVDWRWIDFLWSHGATPVIASVAPSAEGEYYNLNADEVASACAAACGADALVFLTDVPGVRAADGRVMPTLDVSAVPALIEQAAVSGGMLPKLEACARALEAGVRRVCILPAAAVGELPRLLVGAAEMGTEVVIR